MADYPPRLGDLIDDHCPRCRLLLNHAIASMVNGQVVKVICQTCYTEHAYLRGEGGKKKVAPRSTLFDQVLAKVEPSESEPEEVPAPAKKKEPAAKPVKAKKAAAPQASAPEKKVAEPARYISRHKTRPPRRGK
jgi:hypothetical protein